MDIIETTSVPAHPEPSVRPVEQTDAEAVTAYLARNVEFHREWSPIPPADFLTVDYQRRRLVAWDELRRLGREYRFGIFVDEQGAPEARLIGLVSMVVERGSFMNGRFGYSIDGEYTGRGVMTAALRELMRFGFFELGLHRLEANIMPRNVRSRRVLEKCGFAKVGYSPRMLFINGAWEDHEMYAIVVDDFRA
jgi:ribosomal-protein-alanine N-acetyltransferase